MRILTKKDLLEAIEDMPMDAEIAYLDYENYNEEANSYAFPSEVIFHEQRKIIVLC